MSQDDLKYVKKKKHSGKTIKKGKKQSNPCVDIFSCDYLNSVYIIFINYNLQLCNKFA